MKKVSIMIPAYNEESSLPALYPALCRLMDSHPAYSWEVLFVNDGSTDGTLDLLRTYRASDPRVNILDLSRNFGKERAMLAGFDYVRGDCMILMDADLQDPPEVVSRMLSCWEEGYDDVYGRRMERGEESWLRRHLSLLFYALLQRTSRFDILPNVGDFRLLDRRCIQVLRHLRESERYTKGLFCWIGFRKKEVPFVRESRYAGSSHWSYRSLFELAVEGITSFTTAPLRWSAMLGFTVALFTFFYMLYFFVKTLVWGDPIQGFPTLIIVILFLGGVQLISLGIIGEYLGRIFNESKHRPPYIARSYNETPVVYECHNFESKNANLLRNL